MTYQPKAHGEDYMVTYGGCGRILPKQEVWVTEKAARDAARERVEEGHVAFP